MARPPLEDITATAKDAAYTAVGIGVLVYQRLQVRRRELQKALESRVPSLGGR